MLSCYDQKSTKFWKALGCLPVVLIFEWERRAIIHNMLRAEAESYAALGDIETADKLFQRLITRFPDNVWGYIGWGDIYRYMKTDRILPDYNKAEEKYRLGLANYTTEIEVVNERLYDLEKKREKQNFLEQ